MRCSIVLTLVVGAVLAIAGDTVQAAQTENLSIPLLSAGSPKQTAPSENVVARVYWKGMKQISADTNSASFMTIWDLPESHRLEKQTLDKLSLVPWRLLHRKLDTNAAALLRPLLDDLVERQSFLEICQATNKSGKIAFAIQLDDKRASLWQTNLAAVFESLTGIRPEAAPKGHYGWALRKHHVPNFISLTRAGGWTILGAAEDHNDLLGNLLVQTERNQTPVAAVVTNFWFAGDFDLNAISRALARHWNLSAELPRLSLTAVGDGNSVWTSGEANFSKPLSLDLKPWIIPTNLIGGGLSSITFVRGFQPCLGSLRLWDDLHIGPPPNQCCFWALANYPMESYFAAPLTNASNAVVELSDSILKKSSLWFGTNGLAQFARAKAYNGLRWTGLPYMTPFVRSIRVDNNEFIYGGGLPNPPITPLPLASLQSILTQTNLAYHDWEKTGPRIYELLYLGQFVRYVLQHPQLASKSASLLWLKAAASKLGSCVTDVRETGPEKLSFIRKSSIGLTAIELHLLADWLESPNFPLGLHTLSALGEKGDKTLAGASSLNTDKNSSPSARGKK